MTIYRRWLHQQEQTVARQALPKDSELHGRYRVDTVLGAGGFGITYAGLDLHLNRAVAIKEYFPTEFALREGHYSVRSLDTGNKQFFALGRAWFLREARTLAKYHHPNIVGVMDHFEENNTAYMILRFEEGYSLSRWLRSLGRRPTQFEVDAFLLPILSALEAMHRNNDLHRDVAMDNIILRPEGDPVLIDFGSARQAIGAHSRSIDAVVKFGYSPPEQYSVDAKLQGPWSDIYALAATLHLAITSRLPPDAPGRQLDDTYEPLADSGLEDYRVGLLEGIDWGLRLRPSERPQSISEWRKTLLKSTAEPLEDDPVAILNQRSSPAASGLRTPTPTTSADASPATVADGTVFIERTERHRSEQRPAATGTSSSPLAARITSTPSASLSNRQRSSRPKPPADAIASGVADAGADAGAHLLAPVGSIAAAPWLDLALLALAVLCGVVFFAVSGSMSPGGTVRFSGVQALLVAGYVLALAALAGRFLWLGNPLKARPRASLALALIWLPTFLFSLLALPLLGLALITRQDRPWHRTALNVAGGLHIAAGVLLVLFALTESVLFVLVASSAFIGLGFLTLLTARAPADATHE